jgi:acyl dehydratase
VSGSATVRTTLDAYLDELEVGERFASSGARTITDEDIATFATLSGDHNPLHTDEEFARNGPFGARIAHGALTLAVATGLIFPQPPDGQTRLIAFYGMDRVRWIKPVFAGDSLTARGEVVAIEERGSDRGVVTADVEIVNQDDAVVATIQARTLNSLSPS